MGSLNKISSIPTNPNLKPWYLGKFVGKCVSNVYNKMINSTSVQVALPKPENMGPLRCVKVIERVRGTADTTSNTKFVNKTNLNLMKTNSKPNNLMKPSRSKTNFAGNVVRETVKTNFYKPSIYNLTKEYGNDRIHICNSSESSNRQVKFPLAPQKRVSQPRMECPKIEAKIGNKMKKKVSSKSKQMQKNLNKPFEQISDIFKNELMNIDQTTKDRIAVGQRRLNQTERFTQPWRNWQRPGEDSPLIYARKSNERVGGESSEQLRRLYSASMNRQTELLKRMETKPRSRISLNGVSTKAEKVKKVAEPYAFRGKYKAFNNPIPIKTQAPQRYHKKNITAARSKETTRSGASVLHSKIPAVSATVAAHTHMNASSYAGRYNRLSYIEQSRKYVHTLCGK